MSPEPRPIVFLSDYGLDDDFVGICHAVMARISPRSSVIDLSHAIPPHDVLRGADLLQTPLLAGFSCEVASLFDNDLPQTA